MAGAGEVGASGSAAGAAGAVGSPDVSESVGAICGACEAGSVAGASDAETGAAAEEQEEEPKRKHRHQKAPKNLSTEQFCEKLKENGGVTPVAGQEHRRRRGRGGRRAEPANAESATPQDHPGE